MHHILPLVIKFYTSLTPDPTHIHVDMESHRLNIEPHTTLPLVIEHSCYFLDAAGGQNVHLIMAVDNQLPGCHVYNYTSVAVFHIQQESLL